MSKLTKSLTQISNKLQEEHYNSLVEEIYETIKMAVINSRTMLVEGYWSVGKLIRLSAENTDITDLVQGIAVDLKQYKTNPNEPGISERTLWYCLKAYDTYPDFSNLPDGNNISWTKLIKHLTEPKEKEECEHEPITICRKCRKVLEDTLNRQSLGKRKAIKPDSGTEITQVLHTNKKEELTIKIPHPLRVGKVLEKGTLFAWGGMKEKK